MSENAEQIHATCVAIDGDGVLLRGPSGAGKSDLALRLIDGGALLVADDRVDIRVSSGIALASPPATIRGLLEVRGLGIVPCPSAAAPVPIVLAIDLVARDQVERLPEAATVRIAGVDIRLLALHAFDASTPAKIRLALGTDPDAKVHA